MPNTSANFPQTRISAVIGLRSDDSATRARSWELIVTAYWKPVYKYVRLHWRQSNDDAKDLTQGFFARAIEKEFLGSYDPARASFRTYLRTCLDGFVANDRKSASRLKRGGDARILSLDFETAEGELRSYEIPDNQSVEDFFHEEWVRSLFSLAVEDLRLECETRGKLVQFQIFERYDLSTADRRPKYDELAAEFSLTATTVTNYLAAMRRDFRRTVLDKLREITATDREFNSEAQALLGIGL